MKLSDYDVKKEKKKKDFISKVPKLAIQLRTNHREYFIFLNVRLTSQQEKLAIQGQSDFTLEKRSQENPPNTEAPEISITQFSFYEVDISVKAPI